MVNENGDRRNAQRVDNEEADRPSWRLAPNVRYRDFGGRHVARMARSDLTNKIKASSTRPGEG
jgi:hypothetical protein